MIQQPDLGKKIADLRKAKGLTQEELVDKCNLNVRTLQRIESGEVTPRTYTIRLIFEALDFSLEESQTDKGFIQIWLEQFYISFIDLFNLKTNTMKKISILTVISASIVSGLIFLNSELGAQNNSNAVKSQKDDNKTAEKGQESDYYIRPKVNKVFQWALNSVEVNLSSGNNFVTNNGVIKRQDDHIFIIPYKTGELKVTSEDYSQEFEVLPLPAADFKIGGENRKRGSKITVSQLLENEEIKPYYGFGITTDFEVFEYSIFFNQDKEDEERVVINGNTI